MAPRMNATEVAALAAKMAGAEVTGDEAKAVLYDVVDNVPVERSKVAYSGAMLRYREAVEADIAKMPAGTVVTIPDL